MMRIVLAAVSVMLAACGGGGRDDDHPGGGGSGGGGSEQPQGLVVSFSPSVRPFQEYDDNGRLQNSSVNRTFGSGDTFALWAVTDGGRPTGSGTTYSYKDGLLQAVAGGLTTDGRQSAAYYAVTPRTSASAGVLSFTVTADQSTESRFWANDLCTAMAAAATDNRVSLSFSHRLCCVCVNFVGDAITGTISQVRLNGVRLGTQMGFDGGDDQPTGSASTVHTLQQGQNYYAIVPAQTFAAGSQLAIVTLDGEDYDVTFDEAVSFEGGMMHYLDITYDGDKPAFVGLSGDINPWQK